MNHLFTSLRIGSFCSVLFLTSLSWGFGGRTSSSCTFSVPDKTVSGDDWYGPSNWDWCRKDWLKNLADGYGMTKENWDDGFGWDDACNTDLPFGRLSTARVALEVSSATPQFSGSIDINKPMLDWTLLWSFRLVDDLRGSCGVADSAVAAFQPGNFLGIGGSDYIHLNVESNGRSDKGWFYGYDVVGRASIFVHEARHWDGGGQHVNDAGDDQRFKDGGAHTWQAIWLWWFAVSAVNAPPALRCSARDFANQELGSRFVEDPGIVVVVDGLGC